MLNSIHVSKKRSNIQEDNPKTMSLENLVRQIDSHVLAYYLEQISIFLKNSKRDMWFPKLSPHLDALLVRMIKDVQNITKLLDTFDSKSKIFAIEIIDALQQNENVYCLSYIYENSKIEHDVLVYRKIFKEKPIEQSQPVQSSSSSASHNKDNEATKPGDKQKTGPNIDWVKATLKFVEDRNLDLLEYPIMSFDEANLVQSVIRRQTDVDMTPLGPLCVKLLDAIKLLNETHELKVSYLYVSADEVRLSVEKKLLNNNNFEKTKPQLCLPVKSDGKTQEKAKLNSTKTSDTVSETKTKFEKAFVKKKELLENLDIAFVRTTLKMVLDFLSTEAEASLVFKNANEHQCLFIQSACAIAKTPRFYVLFPSNTVDVLRNINKILFENQCYDVKVDVAKVQRDNKLRTVSLSKIPKQVTEKKSLAKGNDQVQSQNSSLCRSESLDRKNIPKKSVAFQSGGKLEPLIGGILTVGETTPTTAEHDKNIPDVDKENIVPVTLRENKNVPIQSVKEEKQTNSNIDKKVPTDNSTPITANKDNVQTDKTQNRLSRIDKIKQSDPTDFKRPVSVPPQPKDKVDDKTNDTASSTVDGKGLCIRKLKLLKAMSVPMESDIAMRMMRQMGWHGGPLGLRGEGITEPIVPALHLSPGAGLGHVKPENKSKITDAFRHVIFKELLFLLKHDKPKLIIDFKTPISNAQKKYIINIVQLCNERKDINLELEEAAKVVVNEIMEELLCEPDVNLTCVFSPDKSTLAVTKNTKINNANELKAKPTTRDKEVKQMCTELPKVITTKSAKSIGKLYNSTGSVAGKMGLSIILHYKLLEFLKNDLTEYEIKYDFDLSKKFVAFAKFVVQRVNARGMPVCPTTVEYDFGVEILKLAKNKKITVDCDQKRSIIFHKKIDKPPIIETKELSDLANNNNSSTFNKNQETITVFKEEIDEDTDNIQNVIGKDSSVTGNAENCVDDWNEIATDDSFRIKEESVSNDMSFDIETKQDTKDINVNGKDMPKTNTESVYSKRYRSDSDDSSKTMKKTKIDKCVKYIFLTPKCSNDKSNDQLRKFQSVLSDDIDANASRPLLECHGIENGALIYACHNQVGVAVIKGVASKMNFTVKEHENYQDRSNRKMKVILNSYFGINLKKFFNTIECYNDGLTTESWAVLDVDVSKGRIVLLLEVDHVSFKYIMDKNLRLFAGIDRLRFCIEWD